MTQVHGEGLEGPLPLSEENHQVKTMNLAMKRCQTSPLKLRHDSFDIDNKNIQVKLPSCDFSKSFPTTSNIELGRGISPSNDTHLKKTTFEMKSKENSYTKEDMKMSESPSRKSIESSSSCSQPRASPRTESDSGDLSSVENLPNPSNLEKCSSYILSPAEIRNLPSWAYLIVGNMKDRKTWHFPIRDAKGRINKPLLKKVRQELITGKRNGRPIDVRLTMATQQRILEIFRIAWPGLPKPKFCEKIVIDGEEEFETNNITQNDYWLDATTSLHNETLQVLKEIGKSGKTSEEEAKERLEQGRKEEELRIKREQDNQRRIAIGQTLLAKLRSRRNEANEQSGNPQSGLRKGGTKHSKEKDVIVFHLDDGDNNEKSSNKDEQPYSENAIQRSGLNLDEISPVTRRRRFREALKAEARNHLAEKRAIQSGVRLSEGDLIINENNNSTSDQQSLNDDSNVEKNVDSSIVMYQAREEESVADDEITESSEKVINEFEQDQQSDTGISTKNCTEFCSQFMQPKKDESNLLSFSKEASVCEDIENSVQKVDTLPSTDPSLNPEPVRTYSKKTLDESKIRRNNEVTRALQTVKELGENFDHDITVAIQREKREEPKSSKKESAEGDKTMKVSDLQNKMESKKATAGQSQASNDKNLMYRKLLEEENLAAMKQRLAKRNNIVEDEASEEEEDDDGFGDYGLGTNNKTKQKESDLGIQRITKDDLENIVDTFSDDEGEDHGDGSEYHREYMEKKEEEDLKKLQEDVENHRVAHQKAARRSRNLRVDNALSTFDYDSDDESTDEELEMARQERYNNIDQERRRIAESKAGGELKESLEEVEDEIEQQAQFLQAAKLHRRKMKRRSNRNLQDGSETHINQFIGEENSNILNKIKRCNSNPPTLNNGSGKKPRSAFLTERQKSDSSNSSSGFQVKTLSSRVVFLEENNKPEESTKKKKRKANIPKKAKPQKPSSKRQRSELLLALSRPR